MTRKANIVPLLSFSFILAGIILFTTSCVTKSTYQNKSAPAGFRGYVIIEVPDFKMSSSSATTDATWKIPNEIAKGLEKEGIFTGVSRSPVSLTEKVLVVDGTLDFVPTPWYNQIATTQKLTAHVRFVSKSDNSVIAEATFEEVSKGGIFSGGVFFDYDRLAEEIVAYIKLNYSS